MTVHADILKELLIAGYEGSHLLAAFDRLCASLARHGIEASNVQEMQIAPPLAAPMVKVAKASKAKPVDRRQREFVYPIDGGMAKTAPLSAAERQARRRDRLKNVTQLVSHGAQAIDFIDESRNVTKSRDTSAQAIDSVGELPVSGRDVTGRRGKKEVPPHPLKKKHNPLNPQRDGTVAVSWDDPLMPFCQQATGHRFKRFSATLTFKRSVVEQATALMAEHGASPPLRATG